MNFTLLFQKIHVIVVLFVQFFYDNIMQIILFLLFCFDANKLIVFTFIFFFIIIIFLIYNLKNIKKNKFLNNTFFFDLFCFASLTVSTIFLIKNQDQIITVFLAKKIHFYNITSAKIFNNDCSNIFNNANVFEFNNRVTIIKKRIIKSSLLREFYNKSSTFIITTSASSYLYSCSRYISQISSLLNESSIPSLIINTYNFRLNILEINQNFYFDIYKNSKEFKSLTNSSQIHCFKMNRYFASHQYQQLIFLREIAFTCQMLKEDETEKPSGEFLSLIQNQFRESQIKLFNESLEKSNKVLKQMFLFVHEVQDLNRK